MLSVLLLLGLFQLTLDAAAAHPGAIGSTSSAQTPRAVAPEWQMPERFGGGAKVCQAMHTVRLSNALGDVNGEALASTASGNGVVAWFEDTRGDGSATLRSVDWQDGCRTASASLALPAEEVAFELALAMNDQRVVAIWDQIDSSYTHVVMSSQHILGGGWTQPVALSKPEDSTAPFTGMDPVIAISADGARIAAWFEFTGGADRLVTASTTAAGGWAKPAPISAAGFEPASWNVGIDRRDNPVVSWVEYSLPSGTSAMLKAAWGSSGGPSLAHVQTIASFGPGALAYDPKLAVSGSGEATIVYYADTAGIGSPTAVFATSRPKPTDSFHSPRRLSGGTDNATPGAQTVAVDTTDHAFAAWNAEGAGSPLRYSDRAPFPAPWAQERTLAGGGADVDATFAPTGALAVAFTQALSDIGDAVQIVLRPPGQAFGQPLRVSEDGTSNPVGPLVGLDRRGRLLASWEQEGPNGAKNQVWAAFGKPGAHDQPGSGPLENNSWTATHPDVNPKAPGPPQLPRYEVDFDACASNPDQVSGVTYQLSWTGTAFETGASQSGSTAAGSDCQIRVPGFGPQGTYTVTLKVTDPSTGTTTATVPVRVRDYLIVSIGDSYGSGEGAPDVPLLRPDGSVGPAQWARSAPTDPNAAADNREAGGDNCHRSTNAPGAVVARTLEERDPHSSVTFIHLACTGAEVIGPDHHTGGLLSDYSPQRNGVYPPQVARLEQLVCDRLITVNVNRQDPCPRYTPERPIDALIVSIGGNDSGFGDRIFDCLFIWNCETRETALAEQIWPTLGQHYDALGPAIARLPLRPQDVYLVEYGGATQNGGGHYTNLPGLLGPLAPPPIQSSTWGIDAREARWADQYFRSKLDEIGSEEASKFQWARVTGIVADFSKHGIPADAGCTTVPNVPCLLYRTWPHAPDRWVNSLEDSFLIEGVKSGAVHPNATGYAHYASHILGALHLPDAPSRWLAPFTFLAPVAAPATVVPTPSTASIHALAACSAACRIKATLLTGSAARAPLAPGGAVLGRATATSATARGVRIRVRLNARGRRLVHRLRRGATLKAHLATVITASNTGQTRTATTPVTFAVPRRRLPIAITAVSPKTTREVVRSGRYLLLIDCQRACRVSATLTAKRRGRAIRLGHVRKALRSGLAILPLKPTGAGARLLRARRRVVATARIRVFVGHRRVVLVSRRVVIRR